jgi:NAD-dependent dihydropyrimidine dehydrogenase PreA subunit
VKAETGKIMIGLEEIDLDNPNVKALWDYYGEDKRDDFLEAYFHLKYYYAWNSGNIHGTFPTIPLTKEAKELLERRPDIARALNRSLANATEDKKKGVAHAPVILKVTGLRNAIKLVTQEVNISLRVPKSVVPVEQARNIILDSPATIALGKCPCRMVAPQPCKIVPYPYETCIYIIKPVVPFLTDQNPFGWRRITQEEAVSVLENAQKMGLVTSGAFRRLYGGRLYCICNCCDCCCGGLMGHNNYMNLNLEEPSPAAVPSGYVSVIGDNCKGCGTCAEKCRFHAITLNKDKGRAEVNFVRCMGCGVCEAACPNKAITMRVEPSKGGILDLDELKKDAEKII